MSPLAEIIRVHGSGAKPQPSRQHELRSLGAIAGRLKAQSEKQKRNELPELDRGSFLGAVMRKSAHFTWADFTRMCWSGRKCFICGQFGACPHRQPKAESVRVFWRCKRAGLK
jgi:hypothetical protein